MSTWAGSVPAAHGVAPKVRMGKSRWFNLLWLLPRGFLLLLIGVAVAKGLRNTTTVQRFIVDYPGTAPRADSDGGYLGVPSWARWPHFLNLFFMLFILRSGLQILTDHPRLYWTRHCTPGRDWFRIQKPVPADPLWTAKQDSISISGQVGLPGIRHSIGLARCWHLGIDMLWLLNGLAFYVLLFSTGQWRRLIPTSWSVFPNAVSVAIQSVAGLAGGQRLGRLQRAATAGVLRDRFHRRAGGADHRARDVAGTVDAIPRHQPRPEHPDCTLAARTTTPTPSRTCGAGWPCSPMT